MRSSEMYVGNFEEAFMRSALLNGFLIIRSVVCNQLKNDLTEAILVFIDEVL